MSDAATTGGADWDHAPCGLVVARVDGSLVAQNRTLLGWTGRAAGAPGRMPELFTVPGALFYETHCAPLLRLQGFVAEISLELRGAGGEPLPVLLSANVRREGEVATIHAALFHAPTRREYERELQVARRRAEEDADLLRRQAHELAERSALLIPVRDDLYVMPLIGAIDPVRGRHIVQTLLHLDAAAGIRWVLIDLTGVPEIGADAAAILRTAAAGLRLRGVRPVLTGLRPRVAATLVAHAIDLAGIEVCGTLQDGIQRASAGERPRGR